MLGPIILTVVFVLGATLVVKLVGRRVPPQAAETVATAVPLAFLGLFFLTWWIATRGNPASRLIAPALLGSPRAVLAAYPLVGFFIFGVIFVAILTGVVRLAGLRVRAELSESRSLALTAGFVALLLFVWWLLTRGERIEDRVLAPLILPNPLEVLQAFPKLHFEQQLVRSVITSFVRVTLGFFLATLVAVPLGVYMATFRPIAAAFRPLALIGAYVPIVVFVPLTLAWFGLSETQKVGFLFIGCFVALLPLVIKSIADVPVAYLDVTVTKGATQWQLVRHVLFPVAQADIWDHLRGVYGVGWGWIILAEVVNAEKGLGHLIQVSERLGHTASIFAIIIVIVAIAVACDQLWRLGGRLLFPYRQD
jgi:NitT/TauT family transport system permease protein